MSKYDKENIEKITTLKKEAIVKVDELEKHIDDIVELRNKKGNSYSYLNDMMTLVIRVEYKIEESLKICNEIKYISGCFDDKDIINNIDSVISRLERIRNKNEEIKNMPVSDMFRM